MLYRGKIETPPKKQPKNPVRRKPPHPAPRKAGKWQSGSARGGPRAKPHPGIHSPPGATPSPQQNTWADECTPGDVAFETS